MFPGQPIQTFLKSGVADSEERLSASAAYESRLSDSNIDPLGVLLGKSSRKQEDSAPAKPIERPTERPPPPRPSASPISNMPASSMAALMTPPVVRSPALKRSDTLVSPQPIDKFPEKTNIGSKEDDQFQLLSGFFKGTIPQSRVFYINQLIINQDINGVRQLVGLGAYRTLVPLATKLLTTTSPGHPDFLYLASTLITAELRLKRPESASTALSSVLSTLQTSGGDDNSSRVPWLLELLRADILHAMGQTENAIIALHVFRTSLKPISIIIKSS